MHNIILNQILFVGFLSIIAFSISYARTTGSTRGNRKTRIIENNGTFYVQVRFLWVWCFCKKYHPEWTTNWEFDNIEDALHWQQEYYSPIVYSIHSTSVVI